MLFLSEIGMLTLGVLSLDLIDFYRDISKFNLPLLNLYPIISGDLVVTPPGCSRS